MCGRIRQSRGYEGWKDRFDVDEFLDKAPLFPRFNVAPTQTVHVIRLDDDGRRVAAPMTWGFVPNWTAELGKFPAPINARSDSVATKPTFRHAFKRRRCVVPVDGFYEWRRAGGAKQPFHIVAGESTFPLAGVWDRWEQDGKTLETFAVVTTDANELVGRIHDRMPVILDDADIKTWLEADPKDAAKLMRPFAHDRMTMYPVSTFVNNARNQGEKCAEPAEA